MVHHNHRRNHRNGSPQPSQKSQKWFTTTARIFFSLAATKVTSSNYLSFCPQGAHVSVSLVVLKYSIVIMYCTSIGKTNVGKTPLVRLPTEWPSLLFILVCLYPYALPEYNEYIHSKLLFHNKVKYSLNEKEVSI